MHRLDHRASAEQLPPSERRIDAQRLQEWGLTPIGAHQAMHGKVVTDPADRAIVAELLHKAITVANATLKV